MQAHEMEVVIPQDHRLVLSVPETIGPGPARLILLTPSQTAANDDAAPQEQARGRMAALRAELADQRSFRELRPEERLDRLRRVRGIGRGLGSTSEEFADQKREEIAIEERKSAS